MTYRHPEAPFGVGQRVRHIGTKDLGTIIGDTPDLYVVRWDDGELPASAYFRDEAHGFIEELPVVT